MAPTDRSAVPPATTGGRRWAGLDGLRAVAVVAVVGFHADHAVGNGYLGVDVFFVLSGFLITTLVLGELSRTGALDVRAFFRRRALRLFPALVTVCVLVAAGAVVTHRQVGQVVGGAVASVLYVNNLWLYSGHPTPLLEHTWTLALEWQFYLVWPVVLAVLHRRRVSLGVVGGALAAGWVVASLAATLSDVGPVLGTYVRGSALVLGCAAAFLARGAGWARRLVAALAPSAALGLLLLLLAPTTWTAWSGGLNASLVAVLTVPVVLALTGDGPRWLSTAMSARPLVWLGERSYGLYLWHFPILSLAINQVGDRVPLPVRLLAAVLLAVLVAAASYRWVEQPFLRRSRPRAAAAVAG